MTSTDFAPDLDRAARPRTPRDLWYWVYLYTGVRIANRPVCPEHSTPWQAFRSWYFDDPEQALMVGARGVGKSFLAAINTHVRSRFTPGHGTRILGGSLAQSGQIHEAISLAVIDGRGPFGWSDRDAILDTSTQSITRYANGSEVKVLAASRKSVRGPHVPDLKLDEIDEMDPDILASAVGMAMDRAKRGMRPDGLWGDIGSRTRSTILKTSTWHRPDGPVGVEMARAEELNEERPGSYPVHVCCSYDVLERCPDDISGPHLEYCPACPLVSTCHDVPDGGPPRAKRGNGHYTVRDLIQKANTLSKRGFGADFLCRGPSIEGVYFPEFDPAPGGRNVPGTSPRTGLNLAEFDPNLEVHLAIDPGVHAGAVFGQKRTMGGPFGHLNLVNVFADHYAEFKAAETVAREIREVARQRCRDTIHHAYCDPAGDSATPIGPTTMAEYARGGITGLQRWSKPKGSVSEGLVLTESLIGSAGGHVGLIIHPRCVMLIKALTNFRRKKAGAGYEDRPEDPQHPHEDMIEALRGMLRKMFPLGLQPQGSGLRRAHPASLLT